MPPETLATGNAVYSARPTVRIDTRSDERVAGLLRGMEMTEQEGGLSALELRLGNIAGNPQGGADYPFEADDLVRLGASIAVYAGDEGSPQEIFRGVITGLEAEFEEDAAPELVVLAEDRLQQARLARRTATYDEMSVADIARRVAGGLGLTPRISGLGRPCGVQVQLNESDLAFLRRLLARYDADAQVVGDELHVSPRGDVRRGALSLELGSQLRRARVAADLAHQVTAVTVTGWDPEQGSRVDARSVGAALGPGSGSDGARVLGRALGERVHHVGHLAATTQAEADAIAAAAFDARARRFLHVEGTAEGNPALRVGSHVALAGLGRRFDNTYFVTYACHRWDEERGYQTDFEAECAFWGGS